MVKLKPVEEKFVRLEKSYNYYNRKKHMRELHVPGIGETRRELGEGLAKILFQQCPEPMKPEVGLLPLLEGAGDELWVSPSDLLIPKVCLKPPLTNKYIKALTHEGILIIGEDIDRRYWLQMENEKAKALEDQRELLMRIAEMERKVAIKLAREEEKRICANYIQNIMEEFEKRLAEELKNLEQQMLEMQDELIRQAVEQCDLSWRMRIEEAINEVVEQMSEQFAEDLENEKKELEVQFRLELEKQNTEFNYALKREQEFCEITLKQLRHCLECKNLANLMYVLCMERKKCTIEKSAMDYIYKTKISELETQITKKDEIIAQITADKERKQRQLDIREECLLVILKEFQKFINFVLKAVPTQAEFLLSVEKMILYEIARQNWVLGQKKPLKHLCKKIFSWKSDSKTTEPTPKDNLEPKDYHKCLDEVSLIGDLDESDTLPFFYYKEKLYVRRDMEYYFDNGIEISETNLLWNKDVDNLMQILTNMKNMKISDADAADGGSECRDKLKVEEVTEVEVAEEEEVVSTQLKQEPTESKSSKHSEVSKKSEGSSLLQKKPTKTSSVLKRALKPIEESEPAEDDEMSTYSPQIYPIQTVDNTGLLAAQDSLSTIKMSRRSSLKGVQTTKNGSLSEMDRTTAEVNEPVQATPMDKLSTTKKNALAEGGTVSFERFQAIRILDEIELTKPSNRSSRISLAKPKLSPKSDIESILQKKPPSKAVSGSKLLQATDSLIIHRHSLTMGHKLMESQKQQPVSHRGSVISKLSFTKDSLELLRRQSFLYSKNVKKESEIIEDTLLLGKTDSVQSQKVEKQDKYQRIQKVVSPLTVSHIGVAKIPTDTKEADVKFSPIHEVYETNVLKSADSPWNIYKDETKLKVKSSSVSSDKTPVAEVVGDRKDRDYMDTTYMFTDKRIRSIMTILKKDPTLIRLFTRVKN
nr:uncharacterized protein LOC111413832 [Onthophagus taurus]